MLDDSPSGLIDDHHSPCDEGTDNQIKHFGLSPVEVGAHSWGDYKQRCCTPVRNMALFCTFLHALLCQSSLQRIQLCADLCKYVQKSVFMRYPPLSYTPFSVSPSLRGLNICTKIVDITACKLLAYVRATLDPWASGRKYQDICLSPNGGFAKGGFRHPVFMKVLKFF